MMHSYRITILLGMLLLASPALAQQNVVILLDDSGSMNQAMRVDASLLKMNAAKSAIGSVLRQLPDDAQVGLAVLNGNGTPWVIPFGPIDKANIEQQLNNVYPRGSTPLGEHMKIAADALLDARSKQFYGVYKLLIITDGEAGDPNLVERYLPEIQSRGIIVDVIGVDMVSDHSLATQTSSYRRADDPDSLAKAISAVLAETTVDSGDPGTNDFDLLEGFPAEAASAAITALANPSNAPIDQATSYQSDVASGQGSPSGSTPARVQNNEGGGSFFFILLLMLGIPAFLVFRIITKTAGR